MFSEAEFAVGHLRRATLDTVRLGRNELVHGVDQLSHLLGERRLLLVKLGEALGVRLVHRLQLLLEQDTMLGALEGLTRRGRGEAVRAVGGWGARETVVRAWTRASTVERERGSGCACGRGGAPAP